MPPDVDTLAQLAYEAFCASPGRTYMPLPPEWTKLHEVVKEAWRAATRKILESR
jgi:hypothetical protein